MVLMPFGVLKYVVTKVFSTNMKMEAQLCAFVFLMIALVLKVLI